MFSQEKDILGEVMGPWRWTQATNRSFKLIMVWHDCSTNKKLGSVSSKV